MNKDDLPDDLKLFVEETSEFYAKAMNAKSPRFEFAALKGSDYDTPEESAAWRGGSERGYAIGKKNGSAEERALAVEYIRNHGGECLGGHPRCIDTIFEDAARGLERGEHLAETKE